MVSIRRAGPDDVERVNAFYAASGTSGRASKEDTVVLAEREGDIIGVVRLCAEHGRLVLRSMRVGEGDRGRGVGARMLRVAETLIGERPCYCLPHAHLSHFYGRIGFVQIAEPTAPSHLRERLRLYRDAGLRLIVMGRPSGQNPASSNDAG